MPVARIHSHLTPLDVERLAFMAKTARDILSATGVQKLLEETGSYDFFHGVSDASQFQAFLRPPKPSSVLIHDRQPDKLYRHHPTRTPLS